MVSLHDDEGLTFPKKTSMSVPLRQTSVAGFSLTELLVAIVLMAVLVVMGFTAVGRLKRSTQQHTCVQNLRQIGVATLTYLNEHNGMFPGPVPSMQRTTTYLTADPSSLSDFLAPYLGMQKLTKNLVEVRQFICPAAKVIMDQGSVPPSSRTYYLAYSFYVNGASQRTPFGYRATGTSVIPPSHISSLPNPAKTLLLIDLDGALLQRRGIIPAGAPPYPSHDRVRNVLFADGHVESVLESRLRWQSTGSGTYEIH